jgi:hypothetical protein
MKHQFLAVLNIELTPIFLAASLIVFLSARTSLLLCKMKSSVQSLKFRINYLVNDHKCKVKTLHKVAIQLQNSAQVTITKEEEEEEA